MLCCKCQVIHAAEKEMLSDQWHFETKLPAFLCIEQNEVQLSSGNAQKKVEYKENILAFNNTWFSPLRLRA